MVSICEAEIKRALLLLDHHLSWIERDMDVATAQKVNQMIQRTSEQSERVYKRCRITLCTTCDAILQIHPEMDRMEVHRKHKIDQQRF